MIRQLETGNILTAVALAKVVGIGNIQQVFRLYQNGCGRDWADQESGVWSDGKKLKVREQGRIIFI